MNVFIMSMALRVVIGLSLLGSAKALLARYLWADFHMLPGRMLELLPLKG